MKNYPNGKALLQHHLRRPLGIFQGHGQMDWRLEATALNFNGFLNKQGVEFQPKEERNEPRRKH